MGRKILTLTVAAILMGGPAFAGMEKHDDAMCTTHCNIMDLQKKVDGLKAQQAGSDKVATKEHLRKDIEQYEKKLEELKAQLEAK